MAHPLTEAEFRAIYAKVPRLCVDLIIRDEDGRILLAKRSIAPFLNLWHIPGGAVYFGETIEMATKRIAQEELGLEVKSDRLLDVLVHPDEYKDDWHGWPVSLEIETIIISGTPLKDENASEIGFFAKLPQPMVESHRLFLSQKLGYQEEAPEK